MKKLVLSIFASILCLLTIAQNNPNASLAELSKLLPDLHMSAKDLAEAKVISAYDDPLVPKAKLYYLQQTYLGIPVYNQLRIISTRNGALISDKGTFIASPSKRANSNGSPALNAPRSVMIAAADRKLALYKSPGALQGSTPEKSNFGTLGISRENVTAELLWVPVGKSLRLAWQVSLVPYNSDDYWLVRVDAMTSEVLDVSNLTVYCNWDQPLRYINNDLASTYRASKKTNPLFPFTLSAPQNLQATSPAVINGASYRVVGYPAESPKHPGGTPSLRSNPWTLAPGNATSLKWHSDGVNDYNYTRGNNVWAAEDRAATNNSGGLVANSTTADPLTFDFMPDFTVSPTQATPVQNQQFNITNLFYENNIMHDISYLYGFNEAAANFQQNNQGRGGQGNDYVVADAQDGGGSNNANFSTPPDGGKGRMQMYLFTGNPQYDGDVDNGVISHEYAHGISNRLTGGGIASCLGNAEQMGEGWSDYYALMVTQDWSTSTLNDGFNVPRGMGTYVVNQNPNGVGIRSQKYCTNLAVNNKMYTSTISSESHNRGEIWCAVLWDMTWNIIQQVGSINPNLFDAGGNGGNIVALKLVTQGLKMQACSPGFLDGRDGILAADQLLYNGLYRCSIMQAFARRGMGFDAKQGSSDKVNDQVPGFSLVDINITLSQSTGSQLEGQNITYTNRVSVGACASATNYLVTDTLPANVTWISGGTYNPANRVVSFLINQAASTTQDYAFTVKVNVGSYFPTVTLFEDSVLNPTVSPNWTATSSTSGNWTVSSARSHSPANSYFSPNRATPSDQILTMNNAVSLPPTPPNLTFWHYYNTEGEYDGGVLEISTDNGNTWNDIGAGNFIRNGYNSVFSTGTLLIGRPAWTGNSGSFIKTIVNLQPYANQSIKLRYRFNCDDGTSIEGWYVDDIAIKNQATIEIKSNLFDPAGRVLDRKDTLAIIQPSVVGCSDASISSQPTTPTVCTGSAATFSVTATGSGLSYQWQLSTDGGNTFTNISGATAASYTTPVVTGSMSNYKYRVVISSTCSALTATSSTAGLSIFTPVTITGSPASITACEGSGVTFTVAATGSNLTYQWQLSPDGVTFTNIPGATGTTYTINTVALGVNNTKYRAVVTSAQCGSVASSVATLNVKALPVISVTSNNNNGVDPAHNVTLTANVTPAGTYNYQWYLGTVAISGATSNTITATTDNVGSYSVKVTEPTGNCSSTSAAFIVKEAPTSRLFISPNPGTGLFQVRYYNTPGSTGTWTLTAYDSKGARVWSKAFQVNQAYQRLDVDLMRNAAGIYMIQLVDGKGKKIATGAVKKI